MFEATRRFYRSTLMREIPILFSAPMVRALLDGRKTVTRRALKLQPVLDQVPWAMTRPSDQGWLLNEDGLTWRYEGKREGHDFPLCGPYKCPYGQPGDQLWVREAFALQSCVDGEDPPFSDGRPIKQRPDDDWDGVHAAWTQPHYRATDPAPDLCCENSNCAQCRDHDMGPHWRPSIYMPRWASRIKLEVIRVRVERLQAISEDDAIAEGIHRIEIGSGYLNCYSDQPVTWAEVVEGGEDAHDDPRYAFRDLWQSINGAGSWDANPWVWVVEFKVAKP